MKYGIYCVKDLRNGSLSIMQDTNDASAMRNFAYAVNKADSVLSWACRDYALYKIGVFDSEDGTIDDVGCPKLICDGVSVKERDNDV